MQTQFENDDNLMKTAQFGENENSAETVGYGLQALVTLSNQQRVRRPRVKFHWPGDQNAGRNSHDPA